MTYLARQATSHDAVGMSLVLGEVIRMWKSDRVYDADHVLTHYITHPDRIACTVIQDDAGDILGFQSLKRAKPGNIYDVTPGWGIIGSYVRNGVTGQGIGRALFAVTQREARTANLPAIDATIGTSNKSGLAYYQAIGFQTYLTAPGKIRKRFDLESPVADQV